MLELKLGDLGNRPRIAKFEEERVMAGMHEVDYKVFGEDIQFVEIELDPGEAAVAEAGGMFYMEDGISMETYSATAHNSERLLWMHCSGQGSGCWLASHCS